MAVASVDENGIESLFPFEQQLLILTSGTEDISAPEPEAITLLQNRPNPFDEATIISWYVSEPIDFQEAYLQVADMNGQILNQIPATLNLGTNEILYHHGYGVLGTYIYSLIVDDLVVESRKMVFAN